MRLQAVILSGLVFLAGCRESTPPAPADKPVEKPKAESPTAKPAAAVKPQEQSVGSAVVDMITQRDKVEAGKRAKATIEATAAKENKDLEEALNQ